MAYTIVKSDGTVLTSIADGTINTTSTSLGLPGRNYAGYGQSLDTNFVHQIESYAASTPPSNPLRGQLWYDINNSVLKVCPIDNETNASNWLTLTSTASGGTTTFGAVTVTGNIQSNNLSATNYCNAANGVFTNISVSANANIGVAKAALYPTISLTAALGGESLELSNILKSAARIWTGGLSLHLPIFDSGKTGAQVEQASAQQKQALASYESAIQNAFREVNDALVNVRQSTEREFALNESRVAAKKALEISKNRYQSGYSAYLEVLDSQRAYNEAALAFVQSRQSRLFATVELFKALGGGWHSDL